MGKLNRQKQVQEPVGPPQVDRDEQQAHDDHRHGQQFAEDHHVVQVQVAVDVDRNHQHRGGGRQAHQVREVGDVEPPGNLVGHARGDQPVDELLAVGVEPGQRKQREHEHPQVVAPVADEAQPEAIPEETEVLFMPRPPAGGCRQAGRRLADRLAVAAAALVEVVEEPRHRAHFLLEHVHPLVLEDVGHFALRVEHVAELPRAGGADLQARGQPARPGAVQAEGALLHHPLLPRPVGEVAHVRD